MLTGGSGRRGSSAHSVHTDASEKSSVDSEFPDEYGGEELPEGAGFMDKVMAALKKGSKTLVRAFVDYGLNCIDDRL